MTTPEQTASRLRELRLSAMANAYEVQLGQPQFLQMNCDDKLALLVEAEVSSRANKAVARLIRAAQLPEPASLEEVDYRPERKLDQRFLATLGACEWVRQQQSAILVGPTGAGKTYLGAALVTQACRLHMSARWYRMGDLLEEIATAHLDGSLPAFKKELAKPTLLAIDDFGLGVIDATAATVMLQVIDRRVRAGGCLLFTSQFPVAKWHDLFPDPSVADAILDRFVHGSHVMTLTGESMRKLMAKKK